MPKREGGDALRPPLVAASRSKPGSSNATTSARPSPYALGGNFASSSSSLINIRGNAMSDTNLASISSSGPVPATEAPHLSTSEAFLGRMTLTAPDNMRKKKAEEKEKKKQIKKRRAEKGAMAAATLINGPALEVAGPSTATIGRNNAAPATVVSTVADPSRRRRRPVLPTSNSASNLQSVTMEQSRSRSPTRLSRPQSAQAREVGNRQTSPERRRNRERDRTGSGSSVIEQPPRPHSASATAPAYQNSRSSDEISSQQVAIPSQAALASMSTAAQQRRDIYADLDSLGLPGASESDLEDQPPPFPLNATRPISPPQLPAEGEEWNDDMRRRQEEYEMNRPPDSPPPAFRSDDEGERERNYDGDVTSSDEEVVTLEAQRERQEWELDAAAGFTFEERVERDRMRREARELQAIGGIVMQVREGVEDTVQDEALTAELEIVETQQTMGEGLQSQEVQELQEAVSDIRRDLVREEVQKENVHDTQATNQVGLEEGDVQIGSSEIVQDRQSGAADLGAVVVATPQKPTLVQRIDPEPSSQKKPIEATQISPLNLGQLVMEARARREMAKEEQAVKAEESGSKDRGPEVLQASKASSAPINVPVALPAVSTLRSPPEVSSSHRRVASDGTLLPVKSAATAKATAQAKKRTAIGTGPGLQADQGTSKGQERPIKVTRIRSRPSGEEQSRFRDGASAAANRRMALWGPVIGDGVATASRNSLPIAQSLSDGEILQNTLGNVPPSVLRSAPLAQRQTSSSPSGSAHEGDLGESSDSDVKWDKEEKAFEKMQRSFAPSTIQNEDSSEDERDASKDHSRPPGWFKSTSIDLAKPGSSVPRAPPPLVLGRSRGGNGAEYSSSSSSSSESEAGHMEDDSDDDSLSVVGIEEHLSEAQSSSSFQSRQSDKGKQPVRPIFVVEGGRSTSALLPPPTSTVSVPAGEFEEDSGSSHDFMTDDDEIRANQERRESNESLIRPPLSNRLKGLFSTQLNPPTSTGLQPPTSSAPRASLEKLFDTPLDSGRQARPTSISSSRSSQGVGHEPDIKQPSLTKQPSNMSLRSIERANAYASLEAKSRDLTGEQQARLEALEQISRLQGESSTTASPGVNQDSLDALERLLSRRSVLATSTTTQPAREGPTALTRSGAINRRESTAPFVNPRSSIAPRPFGRLPTITNATRHFPPSSQSSMNNESSAPVPSPFNVQQSRRSGIGTPSWMAYIPERERRNLPEPLEPVKKRLDGLATGAASGPPPPPPPPLPSRHHAAGNRVSAMIERYEVQTSEASLPPSSPRSPSKDVFDSPHLASRGAVDEGVREHTLRRRPPPPPPPPSTWNRHGMLTPTAAPPTNTIEPELQNTISMPTLPSRPQFLPDNIAGPSRSSSEQSMLDSPFLPRQALIPSELSRESNLSMDPPAPRPRRRPLPIPPIFSSPARRTAESTEQQQQLEAESSAVSIPQPRQEEMDEGHTVDVVPSTSSDNVAVTATPARRAPSLGFTDLDLFASRLADEAPADGTNYEDLHLLAEFLGPATSKGATEAEIEALSVGVVEVLRKRIVGKKDNGKDKIKLVLNVMGVKVERCGVCLIQFKEGNMACVFPCLHVLHEDCAAKLLRSTKMCPTCRTPIA